MFEGTATELGSVYHAVGESSGRPYDPGRIGGIEVRQLNYRRVRVSKLGIDVIKKHLTRFKAPDMELAMVERLEEGLQLNRFEDVDRRFYTHELREFVRYRLSGFESGEPANPDAAYDLWNNLHTATLEDYNLEEGSGVLFSRDIERRFGVPE